jgi:dipeptidyl aminopeptidase/acylaminoacyl peptidase
VWALELTGGEPRVLTDAPMGVDRFQWSRNGTLLAYVASDTTPTVDRTAVAPATSSSFDRPNSHFFVLDVADRRRDLPEVAQISWGAFHNGDFEWSPSGSRIAVTRLSGPSPNAALGRSDLRLLSLPPGRGVRRGLVLTDRGGTERGARWSPDGALVAFSGTGDAPEPVGLGDIYVVPAEGGEPRRLAPTVERSGATPVGWLPDGSAVLVAEPAATSVHVSALPVDGSQPRRVTKLDGFRSGFSRAEAGRLAYSFETTDTPPEVYVLDTRTGAETRVSTLHDHLSPPSMGPTRIISWRSVDGTSVEGLLTLPPNAVDGRRYPLAAVLHGGPAAVSARTFTGRPETVMVQSLAQQGFAVLRPNPRGSLGYGPEFRFASVGSLGDGDTDDVLAGIDEAVRLGVAHPDSVVGLGWGYGGYLAVSAASRDPRIKAVSVGAPLSDFGTLALTTDIPEYLIALFGAELWEDADLYHRRSLLPRLGSLRAPTQVFHGAEDRRIPLAQGLALHTGLQRLGVPTELRVLDGASNALDRPGPLLAVQSSIYRWLTGHLRPPTPVASVERPPRQPRRTRFVASEFEPYGGPGDGVIEGRAFLIEPDGGRVFCQNETVFMNPVTSLSTEWYERNVIAREELEPIQPTGYHRITRSDAEGRFRFMDVPPGSYYLGCRAVPEEGFAHGKVALGPGETVSTELVRWIGDTSARGGPPTVAPQVAHWGQLDGTWRCSVRTPDAEGDVRESRSVWTWEYVPGGVAVRDTYVGLDEEGRPRFTGGALRVFNAETSQWEISWVDSASPGIKTFTATSTPDRVVMARTEPDPEWKTVFYDITRTTFDWLTEPSGGRMRCERSID